jgi:hypothetical protein
VATPTPEPASAAGAPEEAVRLIDDFVKELDEYTRHRLPEVQSFQSLRAIQKLPRERQVPVVLEAIARQTENSPLSGRVPTSGLPFQRYLGFLDLIRHLVRGELPFRVEDVDRLVQAVCEAPDFNSWPVSFGDVLRVIKGFWTEAGVPDQLRPSLTTLRDKLLASEASRAEKRDGAKQLDKLLGPTEANAFQLTSDEAWTRHLQAHLEGLDPSARAAWEALLFHCTSAGQSKPSGKWLKQADALVAAIGTAAFTAGLSGVLAEIGKPGTPEMRDFDFQGQMAALDPTLIHDRHSDLLRGLVWCSSLVPDDGLTIAVGDAAAACFKKVPNFGPRSPKIGNACLYALSASSSPAAVGQLARLKTRAKNASTRKQLDKALDTAAAKTGLTADEMEEVAVPTCGLTEVGARRAQLGDVTAVLKVGDGLKAEVAWVKADGKTLKSVPAAVKQSFADDLKALKQSEKEIASLLPAQRDRLEQLFLRERSWSLADFRTRYLDHPLVGVLARRLIWRYSDDDNVRDGIWLDGTIVDEQDNVLSGIGDATRVAPWHPLGCEVERVRAWRDWLDRHEVRQPFKQAHRELYILTDAERTTNTYSNRFAAHIIRQHQFNALCQQRGWRHTLEGQWDSANTPTLRLPRWELRVEFWATPAGLEGDVGHSGVFLYLATDQVRFYRGDDAEPMPLADVPPLVFSEVMRDVDLFVGVASVGNDPNWVAEGTAGRHGEYWHNFSFGDLTETAQTRKTVLERIVPRLKIAGRCSFADKFLVVQGKLHSYKIHLGSGNILMSPNDQYLCIVPKQSAPEVGGKVFLPFSGDNLLSVILSKAFLLAEDTKIKDPTIVSQIQRRQ